MSPVANKLTVVVSIQVMPHPQISPAFTDGSSSPLEKAQKKGIEHFLEEERMEKLNTR